MLSANEKRSDACKKVGREKKLQGHVGEDDFTNTYNPHQEKRVIRYGPTADTSICPAHEICPRLKKQLGVQGLNVSNKSGNNIQVTLGNIPELYNINVDILNNSPLYVYVIFAKYLKKYQSSIPVDILVYQDKAQRKWVFFNINDILNFIAYNAKWRRLASGRIKGDFKDNSKKGYSQYITYEYRTTHKSFFLGFNGNRGKPFIDLLRDPVYGINFIEDNY